MGRGRMGMMMGAGMQRRHRVMMGGIPEPYAGISNPLVAPPEVLESGRALYLANCAPCHGEKGNGDGPAGAALQPPPADLRRLVATRMATDAYLMWAIGEGGAALGTAMPAYKEPLSETQRWSIVSYLRSL